MPAHPALRFGSQTTPAAIHAARECVCAAVLQLEAAYSTVLEELDVAQRKASSTADYRATVAHLGCKMVLEEYLDGDEQVCAAHAVPSQCTPHRRPTHTQ